MQINVYRGDLKSDHLKSRLFEGWISNGWALAMAIVAPIIQNQTIQNPDAFVRISNGL